MKSRVEIKSSDRRLMGVVIPALSDNGFVNITLAMKVLSDDRLKKVYLLRNLMILLSIMVSRRNAGK